MREGGRQKEGERGAANGSFRDIKRTRKGMKRERERQGISRYNVH